MRNGVLAVVADRHGRHELLIALSDDLAHDPHRLQTVNRLAEDSSILVGLEKRVECSNRLCTIQETWLGHPVLSL